MAAQILIGMKALCGSNSPIVDFSFSFTFEETTGVDILGRKGTAVLSALRFLWNSTRGHRLAPWKSDFIRWRVETFSGQPAETLTSKNVMGFFWASRWEILNYLLWTRSVQREARKK